MRCRKCNHVYTPAKKDRSCPQCGYEPAPDEARRSTLVSVRRVKIENRVAIAVLIACPVVGIAALVTGQLLILGGLLAVIVGLYLTLFGILGYFGNLPNGWLARGLCIGFGLVALAGGIASWVWALSGGPVPSFPPRFKIGRIDVGDFAPFVGIGICALASGLGYLINRWLARLEARRRKRSAEEGQVFAIPPMARGPLMMAMVLLIPLMLLLMLSALNQANTGVTPAMGFGVPLVLSPILFFALYMLRHNGGHVVLTKDAVSLRRLGRERRVRYEEILAVKDFSFALPPDLVLRGRGKRLRIPRSVQNFPRLYQIIRQRRDALRPAEAPCFPYRLAVSKGAWVFAISVLAIALFIVGSFKLKQPSELVFEEDKIRFRFPFQGWRVREAGELERVYLDPVHRTVSARHEGVGVSSQYSGAVPVLTGF